MLPYVSRRFLQSTRLLVFVIFGCLLLYSLNAALRPDIAVERFPPQKFPLYQCNCNTSETEVSPPFEFNVNDTLRTEHRVLVLVESIYSRHTKLILQILNASKYAFKLETFSKNLPLLTTATRGRFAFIIIENYYKYLNMPKWNRQLLDKYCKEYKADIVSFIASKPDTSFQRTKIKTSALTFWQHQQVRNLRFSNTSLVPYIARAGASLPTPTPDTADWVLFEPHEKFEAVVTAEDALGRPRWPVVRDGGGEDGVGRILLGHNCSHWLMRLAFVDAARFASKGTLGHGMDRNVQIDIDDVFVGARGTRMTADDAEDLLRSQSVIASYVSNFTYQLGFSGSFFHNGDDNEDRGDERLVELASRFVWFPHMWRHNHAHEHNETYMEAIMTQNKMFAESMRLPVPYRYAISPQHDGVYPVHSGLFSSWRRVWQVEATATEEYPHFRPAAERRGFVHAGIMVLPRQTCGLYTHTQYLHLYPDGRGKLLQLIQGGDLFFAFVLNPMNIFMTHQQNYAHDRLAPNVFESVLRFVRCWTRLRLSWTDPISLSRAYFQRFPQERVPVWNNPCVDPRHRAILPPALNCTNMTLPNLLIVGPQKTGSTALASFLSLHPSVRTNRPVPGSFEELQFFGPGGGNYAKGIEWYIDKFSSNDSASHTVFEKSATYFDHPLAARQAAALLPDAKIVVIVHEPARRAYSWYQHQLAHGDAAAMAAEARGGMETVLGEEGGSDPAMVKLRQRCLSGGRYSHHLDRWLEHYAPSQMVYVDGDRLKEEPANVLTEVAASLGLPPFDFSHAIRFSPSKGFFCQLVEGKTRCLGKSKGRQYSAMSERLRQRLEEMFRPDNVALHKFLVKQRIAVPKWLRKTLDI